MVGGVSTCVGALALITVLLVDLSWVGARLSLLSCMSSFLWNESYLKCCVL